MSNNRNSQERPKTLEELARELGCDEDEERFKETLRRIGRAKPKPEPPPEDQPDQPKSEKKPPR